MIDRGIIRSLYGIPVKYLHFRGISYRSKDGNVITGDAEVNAYHNGRVVFIWETDKSIPEEVRNLDRIDFKVQDKPNEYICYKPKFITEVTEDGSKYVSVFELSEFVCEYLPKNERHGFDKIRFGINNFFFDTAKIPRASLNSDDYGWTGFVPLVNPPSFQVRLGGFRIKFELTGAYSLLKSFHGSSIAPIVVSEVESPSQLNDKFEETLIYLIWLSSGNWAYRFYREIYKSGIKARDIIEARAFAQLNRNPLIEAEPDNYKKFFEEVYPRVQTIIASSSSVPEFDHKRWVENVVNSFSPTSAVLNLLHMGIAIEGMGQYWEFERRTNDGWTDTSFAGGYRTKKNKEWRYRLKDRISGFVSYYGLDTVLTKLADIRNDFAHGMNTKAQKGLYDIKTDYVPIANEFRKAVCVFLGFTGQPFVLSGPSP